MRYRLLLLSRWSIYHCHFFFSDSEKAVKDERDRIKGDSKAWQRHQARGAGGGCR